MFTVHPQVKVKQEGKHTLPPLSHIITSTLSFPEQPQQQQPQQQVAQPVLSAQQHLLPSQQLPYQQQPRYAGAPIKQEQRTTPPSVTKSLMEPRRSPPTSPKYSSKQPIDRCTCKHEGNHIPRPRNAFILFRQQHHQSVLDEGNVVKTNPDVSRELGKRWRDLSPQEKDYWNKLAEEEKKRHAEKYPGYRYIPRRFGKKGSCPYCKKKALLKHQQAQQQQTQLQQLQQQKTVAKQTPAPSLSPSASTSSDDSRNSYGTPSFGGPSSEEHAVAQSFLNLRNQPYSQHQQHPQKQQQQQQQQQQQHHHHHHHLQQQSPSPYYQYGQGNGFMSAPQYLPLQPQFQYNHPASSQAFPAPAEQRHTTEFPRLPALSDIKPALGAGAVAGAVAVTVAGEDRKSCSIDSFLN